MGGFCRAFVWTWRYDSLIADQGMLPYPLDGCYTTGHQLHILQPLRQHNVNFLQDYVHPVWLFWLPVMSYYTFWSPHVASSSNVSVQNVNGPRWANQRSVAYWIATMVPNPSMKGGTRMHFMDVDVHAPLKQMWALSLTEVLRYSTLWMTEYTMKYTMK